MCVLLLQLWSQRISDSKPQLFHKGTTQRLQAANGLGAPNRTPRLQHRQARCLETTVKSTEHVQPDLGGLVWEGGCRGDDSIRVICPKHQTRHREPGMYQVAAEDPASQ